MSNAQCLEKAKLVDKNAVLCPEEYCLDPAHAPKLNAYCHCQPPYPPQDPCIHDDDTPVLMGQANPLCFCCCGDAYRAPCLENARKSDPDAKMCPREYCLAEPQATILASICHCQWTIPDWPFPCSYDPTVPQTTGECYCCCGDYPGAPAVAVDEAGEMVPAARLEVGDPVRVADAALRWRTAAVAFSQGGPTQPGHALRLVFGRPGAAGVLAVTPDAVLLLADGRLKRAAALVPGTDRLVAPGGEPVDLLAVNPVEHPMTLHHLGVSAQPARTVDGHLLAVNGVVAGDWALQLADLEGGALGGVLADA